MSYVNYPSINFFKLNFCKDKHAWPLVHKTPEKDVVTVAAISKKLKEKNVPGFEQVEKGEESFKENIVNKLFKIVEKERLGQIWYMEVWWEQMKMILQWAFHPRK